MDVLILQVTLLLLALLLLALLLHSLDSLWSRTCDTVTLLFSIALRANLASCWALNITTGEEKGREGEREKERKKAKQEKIG